MADDEDEPAHDAKQNRGARAGSVIFRVFRILPQVPIDRENTQTERSEMLLQLEKALRLPEAGLLDRNANVDPVLGVDERPQDERDNPEDTDGGGVGRPGDRAEAGHE